MEQFTYKVKNKDKNSVLLVHVYNYKFFLQLYKCVDSKVGSVGNCAS